MHSLGLGPSSPGSPWAPLTTGVQLPPTTKTDISNKQVVRVANIDFPSSSHKLTIVNSHKQTVWPTLMNFTEYLKVKYSIV